MADLNQEQIKEQGSALNATFPLHERQELQTSNKGLPVPFETPIEHVDTLSLQYPKYSPKIMKARSLGYTDEEIERDLNTREQEALFYFPQPEVNKAMGRTKETMTFMGRYTETRQLDDYTKAMQGKLNGEQVRDRVAASNILGLPATLLLTDDVLYEKLGSQIKMRETWRETVSNSLERERLQASAAQVGMKMMTEGETPELQKELDDINAAMQKVAPAARAGWMQQGVGGALELGAQQIRGLRRGLPYAVAMGTGAAAYGQMGPQVLVPEEVATVPIAVGAGFLAGSTLHAFELEAGSAYTEYRQMADEQGKPMDPNAARAAAILTGVLNAGMEQLQLGTLVKSFPGGEAFVKKLTGQSIGKMLQIPSVRGALAGVAKDYVKGIGTEAAQEMAQEAITVLAGELGKLMSGQEFAGLDFDEALDRILETGSHMVKSGVFAMAPGAGTSAVSGVRGAKTYNRDLQVRSDITGIPIDVLRTQDTSALNETTAPAPAESVTETTEQTPPAGRAVDMIAMERAEEAKRLREMGINAQEDAPIAPTQEETAIETPVTEQPVAGQAVDGMEVEEEAASPTDEATFLTATPEGETVAEAETPGGESDTEAVVFLPRETLEQYNQAYPGRLGELGIDLEADSNLDTGEVMIDRALFDTIVQNDSDFDAATKDDVRMGARAATNREAMGTVANALLKQKHLLRADTPQAEEARGIARRSEEQARAAGVSRVEARAFGQVLGTYALIQSERTGIPVSEIGNVEIQHTREDRAGPGENYLQRMYDAYGQDVFTTELKLEREEAAFGQVVDHVDANKGSLVGARTEKMMTTPLALLLAEQSRNSRYRGNPTKQTSKAEIRDIMISHGVLEKIMTRHNLSPEQVKRLPRALADPIMVLESSPASLSTKKGKPHKGIVAMVEMTDKQGATVIVPIYLEESIHGKKGIYNVATSAYGRTLLSTGLPNNAWFANEANAGRALYIDTQKSSAWSHSSRQGLPSEATLRSLNPMLKTEADLVNARKANEYYFQSATPQPPDIKTETVINPDTGETEEWIFRDSESGHTAEISKAMNDPNRYFVVLRGNFDFNRADPIKSYSTPEQAQQAARQALNEFASRHEMPENSRLQDRYDLMEKLRNTSEWSEADANRFEDVMNNMDDSNPATWGLSPEETKAMQDLQRETLMIDDEPDSWPGDLRTEGLRLQKIIWGEIDGEIYELTEEQAEARFDKFAADIEKRRARAEKQFDKEFAKAEKNLEQMLDAHEAFLYANEADESFMDSDEVDQPEQPQKTVSAEILQMAQKRLQITGNDRRLTISQLESRIKSDEQVLSKLPEARKAEFENELNKLRGVLDVLKNPETYNQSMYHGSPYQFDQFLLSEVGKGEGTQWEGYGIYLTVHKNVAEIYRMRNSGPRSFAEYLQGIYSRDAVGNWVDTAGNPLGENMRFVLDKLEGYIVKQGAWDPEALRLNLDNVEREFSKLLTPEELAEVQPAIDRIRQETKDSELPSVGQTYEVEGPEDAVLLNRDAPLSQQSPDVVAILQKNGLYDDPSITGKELYDNLESQQGGAKQASEYLDSIGIPGAYFNLAGKKAFVVWNPQELQILAKEYPQVRRELRQKEQAYRQQQQAEQDANRARIRFTPEGKAIIDIFQARDASSLFHELGHKILYDFTQFADWEGVSEQYRKDAKAAFDYLGITPDEFLTDADKRVEAHEKFAKSFEAYLAEGKAPSKEMRGVFKRLKSWLVDVYRNVSQALGVELNDEIRGVFDRILATDEQIDTEYEAQTKVGELAAEHAAIREEIKRLERRAREAGAEGLGFVERDVLRKLRDKEKAEAYQKQEITRLAKDVNRMADSESIKWERKKEIERKLADYDLKRRQQKTLDRRAEMEAYLAENPDAVNSFNPDDMKYLGTQTLNTMSIEDLKALHEEIRDLHAQGQREFVEWESARRQKVDEKFSELARSLMKKKVDQPSVQMSAADTKKQYEGIRGKLEKSKDWGYAATLGGQRFFDWLDGGGAQYKGAFVRYFMDEFNAARDTELRHVFERRDWMQAELRKLGLDMQDFSKIRAKNVHGKDFTVDQIMEIYIGMRNNKKAAAILYGVFRDVADPRGTVADLIGRLTPEEKQAAALVPIDHNMNVNRIEGAFIQAFNKGMDREENYTSIHRIEHGSPQGLIDAESAESLAQGMADAGFMRRIEDGFTKARVEMKDAGQTGIKLGLFSNWHDDVSRHEHSAAFAGLARETAGALMQKNPADNRTSLGKMIKERFGDEAWKTLVDYFNIAVTDDVRVAHNVLDGASSYLAKNMSIAFLCGNFGTVMKQMTSIPRFLITAGPHRILSSIGQFMIDPKAFLDTVYELDPQMKDRQGSAMLRAIRQHPEWGKNMYQRVLDIGMEPISVFDRWVAAIGWKATYDANLKRGLSREAAIREAQRAVALTQQTAHAKDAPAIWRQSGFVRLVMEFTSDAAQTFGLTVYDFAQQMRTGQLDKAMGTMLGLTLSAMLMKAATDGIPWDDDDDEETSLLSWILSAFTEQAIESIPLIGKELMMLYDRLSGKYMGSQYSAIVAPIEKLARAAQILTKEDEDEDDAWKASFLALEGLSLLGIAPLPATGIKRVAQSSKLWLQEGEPMDAALNMIGRRPPRRE